MTAMKPAICQSKWKGWWAGKGRDEVERARDGSKEEERERVHWALTVFASKSVPFSQENLARSGGR